jgi:hypothetical protein
MRVATASASPKSAPLRARGGHRLATRYPMPTNTSSASAPSVSVRMTPDDANWVTSRALTRAADIPASWPQSAPRDHERQPRGDDAEHDLEDEDGCLAVASHREHRRDEERVAGGTQEDRIRIVWSLGEPADLEECLRGADVRLRVARDRDLRVDRPKVQHPPEPGGQGDQQDRAQDQGGAAARRPPRHRTGDRVSVRMRDATSRPSGARMDPGTLTRSGGVAQSGRALRSQRRSRGFKSHHLHREGPWSDARETSPRHDFYAAGVEPRALRDRPSAWQDWLAQFSWRSGEFHRDAESASGPGGEGEGSVVCLGDAVGDCQAEADTGVVDA